MIFTNKDTSTIHEQLEVLSREYNICYRACVGSLIYLLSTRVDLCFSAHKLEKCSSNTAKLHMGRFLHLLRYITYNKNLGLKYYSRINYAPLYELLIQAIIQFENQLVVFYDYIWKYYLCTVWSTVEYIVFYQDGPIGYFTYVPGPVSQSIT